MSFLCGTDGAGSLQQLSWSDGHPSAGNVAQLDLGLHTPPPASVLPTTGSGKSRSSNILTASRFKQLQTLAGLEVSFLQFQLFAASSSTSPAAPVDTLQE